MTRAQRGYVRWEAAAKAAHLNAVHPQLISRATRLFDQPYTTTTGGSDHSALDIATVVKASQAISGEIVLSKLLEAMLGSIMENAGAERGALIVERDGELYLEAVSAVGEGVTVLGAAPVADSDGLPVPVVQYVARTGEAIVLDDASESGRFQRDAYVVRRKVKSILCMPIVKQSRRVGILYLENNVVTGAFSPERIEVLKVLSAQAAISLENARLYETLEQKVDQRTSQLRTKNEELASTLDTLQRTQKRLVTQEKLASLGELTAGIAHEMRNPLNFVTNFSESSIDVLGELRSELKDHLPGLPAGAGARLEDAAEQLSQLLGRVIENCQRVNRIVSSMLLHARVSNDEHVPSDINELLSQSMRLAHHSLRGKQVDFSAEFLEDYEASIGPVDIVPADMGRVFLNIIQNACHAVHQKRRALGADFKPLIRLKTRAAGDRIEILIRDNGTGIPHDIAEKIFHPFFTTKPPGEGTGLGLSISHDIVTQKHYGELRVESAPGEYAEFIISIPRRAAQGVHARDHG
jgi:signal transduction histidine kinase